METIKITSFSGYTRISYKGVELARHNLSATTSGTREAFSIPGNKAVSEWLEETYSEEIKVIDDFYSKPLDSLDGN